MRFYTKQIPIRIFVCQTFRVPSVKLSILGVSIMYSNNLICALFYCLLTHPYVIIIKCITF